MILLRQKAYAEENEKSGMSTGKKIALGLGATGVALVGAKYGALGNKAMLQTNRLLGNAGAAMSNAGFKGIGEKMMKSGASGVGQAKGGMYLNNLQKAGAPNSAITNDRIQKFKDISTSRALSGFQSRLT